MKIIVTGGGTGGHIYPALAICDYFKKKYSNVEILFIGTKKGLESDIVPNAGIPFKTITVEGLSRSNPLKASKSILKMVKGMVESYSIIKEFKPDVVIGTGGYVCGPVVMVAAMLKIPTAIHEQNAYPGITNKLLAKYAKVICLTYEESKEYFRNAKGKIVTTGLPVREAIMNTTRREALAKLNLADKPTILIMGGSRGAKSINTAALKVIEEYSYKTDAQVILITGQAGYEEIIENLSRIGNPHINRENIVLKPYMNDMENAFAVADIIVSRAGATVLAEITAKGIPSILVPYPYAAENHQEFNARALEKGNAAFLILDKDLNGSLLLDNINQLIQDKNRLLRMSNNSKLMGKPDAIEKIGQSIIQTLPSG
ncbi:UDP-N-acetylglucosamine--N-acetylmuramyl-(pentapeptide) pyrophosphoryl-undecaprenol N-acetylglucosamine transferase [Desulfitispora alkaliphila]|uniref:undecaprenyldiphospho-muramoylpentapeptide beta-N-acetylglucosaminyltransferase n=1 Tax=Desulfitispora alkaliphila TaxID=622674 RepID=UPI003D1A0ADF